MTQPGAMLYTQGFGSRPENVEVPHVDTRNPTTFDVNYPIGKLWVNKSSNVSFILTSISASQGNLSANWQSTVSTGGISTITGDSGSVIQNNSSVNIVTDPTEDCGKTVHFVGVNDSTLALVVTDNQGSTCIGSRANAAGAGQYNVSIGKFAGFNGIANVGTVAIGYQAGIFSSQTIFSVFIGYDAGSNIGSNNDGSVVIGASAGQSMTGADKTVAIGRNTLYTVSGPENTAVGYQALYNCLGSNNIAIGSLSGSAYGAAAESSNILINSAGVAADQNVIRIGTDGNSTGQQDSCYIAGIFGRTVDLASGTAVFVDTNGQLGTVVSSLKYKDNIETLTEESSVIYKLRPVSFKYKGDKRDGKKYGLIAEEVNEVDPRLVVFNKDNEPDSVKYFDLSILLLNEMKKLKEEIELLKAKL